MGFEKTATGRIKVEPEHDLGTMRTGRLEDSGGSSDMVVDGSSTPVSYTFDANPSVDLVVVDLVIAFVPNVLKFKGSTFGAMPELTNGLEVSVTTGGSKRVLGNIKLSEDWLFMGGDCLIETGLGENDLLRLTIPFAGELTLKAGTSDKIEAIVRDDITSSGANSTKYLQMAAHAREPD